MIIAISACKEARAEADHGEQYDKRGRCVKASLNLLEFRLSIGIPPLSCDINLASELVKWVSFGIIILVLQSRLGLLLACKNTILLEVYISNDNQIGCKP